MKYILYCAIRKKSLINETLYSIASINTVAKINQYTIVIVTDMPECFKQELRKKFFLNFNNIIIEPVSKAMVDNWIGESQYIYRVKIKAIELFFYKYKDNVCFLDCNIFVKRDFDSLFDLIDQNYFIMFDQYVINNREIIKILFPNYRPGTIDYIKHDYIEVNTANQHYKISLDSSFFLSAVLGINYEYRALLSQVLQFNDNLFNITGFSSSE